jgi:hypothetical protein
MPATIRVTPANFTRAETDMYFGNVAITENALGRFNHHRQVVGIDEQNVIRSNRDTLYSTAVFDLDAGPVTITMPDPGKRFMSLILIDEDHYLHGVTYDPGDHALSREKIGTRYVMAAVRTLVDPSDPKDVQQAHVLQDAVAVRQPGGPGRFDVPNWDQASQKKVREAILALGATLPEPRNMFGARDEVDPVQHLIGTALGWGGNPEKDALYLNITPSRNDGQTIHRLTVKDVPVDAFWSISVYNAQGYFEKNELDAYALNNITAKRSADGSVTVQFGGCDGTAPNCLPVTKGWNYLVRLYRPRAEILKGDWAFPEARPYGEREVTSPVARETREAPRGDAERRP